MTLDSNTAHIITFPQKNIIRTPSNNNELLEQAQIKGIIYVAESIVSDLMSSLMHEMDITGIFSDSDDFKKDCIFLTMTMAAMVFRALNIEHPFREVIDNVKIEEVEDISE